MLNIIYSLQAVLLISVFALLGTSMSGLQWMTPYFMPLIITISAVVLITRGGMSLMKHRLTEHEMNRIFLRGVLCGTIATFLYILVV